MNVTLREITPENFDECVNLKVADDQKTFVAANVYSIAQSKVYPMDLPFAVYNDDDEMVGFVLLGLDTDINSYYLARLMIDEKHQGKGYGRAAMLAVIEELKKKNEDCREIYLCCAPENEHAERLYKSLGFERTGELNGKEVVMRLDLAKSTDNRAPTTDN